MDDSTPSRTSHPPNLLDSLDEVLQVASSDRLGLMLDFDGTLSSIAPTPEEATISPAAAASLARLVRRLPLVCVISGRSLRDVRDKVAVNGAVYVGNHGAEYGDASGYWVAPEAEQYRERVHDVLEQLRAQADLPGLVWDDKQYSVSVHYRLAEDPAAAALALSAALESARAQDDLDVFWGKMVLEIRAPVGTHKGDAVRRLVRSHELDAAIYLGDDVTDVDALEALAELRSSGAIEAAGIAVGGDDSPKELLAAADYYANGVPQVEAFLDWLDGLWSKASLRRGTAP